VNQRDPTPGSLDPLKLLDEWHNGIRIAHIGHDRMASIASGRARALGILATTASAVAGTSLVSTLATSNDERWIAFAAVLSVVAAVLTALQTFLNYGDLTARHRSAASAYGDLRRLTEELRAFKRGADLEVPMSALREAWAKLDEEAPAVPQGVHDQAYARVVGSGRTGTRGNSPTS
jgi:hypothetical protein